MADKCFVVMGFGEKQDAATGRTLDLDKSYRLIIKRAVEDAGLECIRADDVVHAGVIDKPMYELLLDADVVVADLSTSNANAIYELGVRHALRPNTTIVIAEKQFKFPFDIGHLLVRTYEHLGKGIDGEEAERMRGELTKAIKALVGKGDVDSPVYTFLPDLRGPTKAPAAALAMPVAPAMAAPGPAGAPQPGTDELMADYLAARADEAWGLALRTLDKMLARRPNEPYLLQQKALATYKGKKPDLKTALLAARDILRPLAPDTTTDAETLGLWGAIHKRLWELDGDRGALDEGIRAYEKGFIVKNDHYTGINLAYMLNQRAAAAAPGSRDAIADTVTAERVRLRVVPLCEKLLDKPILAEDGTVDAHETFWVQASLLEALVGTGQTAAAQSLDARLRATAPESWMLDTMDVQLGRLRQMLGAG